MEKVDPKLELLLRQAAEDEAATLQEARELSAVPGLREVADFVERQRGRDSLRRRWITLLGSAAAVLLTIFLLQRGLTKDTGPVEAPGDIHLGGFELECTAPTGAVESFDSFQWTSSSATGGWFEIVVRDPAQPEASPLARVSRLESPPWFPSEDEVRTWPDEILWQVNAYDRSGAFLTASETSARRSRSH